MPESKVKEIADDSDLIVNGYAFIMQSDGASAALSPDERQLLV